MIAFVIGVIICQVSIVYILGTFVKKYKKITDDNSTMIVKCFEKRMEDVYMFQFSDIENKFEEIRKEIVHLEALIIQIRPEDKERQKGANRKPRTEQQKIMASLKRKEWWSRKKEQDRLAPLMEVFIPPPDQPTPPV